VIDGEPEYEVERFSTTATANFPTPNAPDENTLSNGLDMDMNTTLGNPPRIVAAART